MIPRFTIDEQVGHERDPGDVKFQSLVECSERFIALFLARKLTEILPHLSLRVMDTGTNETIWSNLNE